MIPLKYLSDILSVVVTVVLHVSAPQIRTVNKFASKILILLIIINTFVKRRNAVASETLGNSLVTLTEMASHKQC